MKNLYFSLLSTAWKYAGPLRKRFILIYSMFVVSNLIVATNPLFYGWFITQLQTHGGNIQQIAWMYAVGYLCLKLLEWSMHGPARVMEQQLAFKISRNFQDHLYGNILKLPVAWHQDNHSGSTINKSRKAHEALRSFFSNGFVYLYSFGKFSFSFAAMLYFSPLFGAIGVLIGAITVFIIVSFDRVYIQTLREIHKREHQVASTLFDMLSNITTVITLRLEKLVHTSYLNKLADVFPPFRKNARTNETKWFAAQMMIALIYAVTVLGYIYQHWNPVETFQIGGLIILIGYVNQFTSVFNDIAGQYTQIVKYHTEIQNVKEIENAFHANSADHSTAALPPHWQQITIENLEFIRIDKHTQRPSGLLDISLNIKRGSKVALIGESGSGKSTLLAVLRGLYQPSDQVRVSIDSMSPVLIQHVQASVTLFPQEPEIFENTVLYNITLGLDYSMDDVITVCRKAGFLEVVQNLPEGFDTCIREKGVNLSGGQKQRLALARGILAASARDIILMDEPTSSVDPVTEKIIYSNLFETFRDKAIVSSLHRLHLLPQFDYIYVLKGGQIIDEGSFDHLLRFSLVFQDMWAHQSTEISGELPPYPQIHVAS